MEGVPMMSDGTDLNLSEVLDVLQQNLAADEEMMPVGSGIAGPPLMPTPMETRSRSQSQSLPAGKAKPYLEIIEQPASKALRFRYECEGRSAGSIPGVNYTPENKTFPAIRIVGYKGRAIVVVSCVTKDPPYRPHPHNLVGKDVCKNGVCRVQVTSDNMTYVFDKLGIQCVKRKEIETHLLKRQAEQVDPYNTGFDHRKTPTSIDLNAVRLCFQAFLDSRQKGRYHALDPVVSEPIYDKKAMSDLTICKLSHCTASVAGGTEMVLLCEKVTKEDIEVRFFEVSQETGQEVWEAKAEFQPVNVHKQVAISFRTPAYKNTLTDEPVRVYVQLRRPSDGVTSEPLEFQLLPRSLDEAESLGRKRRKYNLSPNSYMLRHMQAEKEKHSSSRIVGSSEQQQQQQQQQPGLLNQLPQQPYNFNFNVKAEPVDRLSPSHFGGNAASVSPTMFQENISPLQPNTMSVPQQMYPPGRTQSPMDIPMYNLSPVQQVHQVQNMASQLQPIIIPQGSPSPQLDPMLGNGLTNEPINNFQQGGGSIISNAIGDALHISNVLDEPPALAAEFDMNMTAFDSVDFNGLNISEYEATNGEVAAGTNAEETGMTDSFTRLTRNTIQELCTLNDIYKPTRND